MKTCTPARWRGALYFATKDLHHAVEHDTVLGRRMSLGRVTPEILAHWLSIELAMFAALQEHLPPNMRRTAAITANLEELGFEQIRIAPIEDHCVWLRQDCGPAESERRITGSVYVVAGSLIGAAKIYSVLRKTEMPCSAFATKLAEADLLFLSQVRHRGDCVFEARRAFEAYIRAAEWCAEKLELRE